MRRVIPGALVLFAAAGVLLAQDVPVGNWEVPRADLSKLTLLVGAPLPFAPISPPCRLTDTRVTSGGPGPIPRSGSRNFDFIAGGSGDCGTLVKSSRNVEFFYTVNGVRKGNKDWSAIAANDKFFVPEGPDSKLPGFLNEDQRSRLIRNGTYHPDGTVNMETAEKLGWAKAWEAQKAKAPVSEFDPYDPQAGRK